MLSSNIGFLNFITVDILGGITVVVGTCPVHCRMFSPISGHSPLDANSSPSLHLNYGNQK